MRRFIRNIFLFIVIPDLLFFIGCEVLLRNIPNVYSYKNYYLDVNAKNIEVLILGGSTAYYNINPDYLKEKSFNAAYHAQSLNFDYEILRKFDAKLTNLKWIILPLSYPSLFFRLENWREPRKVHNYIIYYGFNNSYRIKDYS